MRARTDVFTGGSNLLPYFRGQGSIVLRRLRLDAGGGGNFPASKKMVSGLVAVCISIPNLGIWVTLYPNPPNLQ